MGLHHSLPAIQNGADFSLDTALTDSADFQVITSTLSENWRLFAPHIEENASCLAALGQIHDHSRTRVVHASILCRHMKNLLCILSTIGDR